LATATENKIPNLLGVVLCGGKSVRMGTDKGLKLQHRKPWALIVAQIFTAINVPVVISINSEQVFAYQTYFNTDTLIIDNQTIPGPLRGLLTVHQQYPKKNLLILACDMVDMQQQTVQALIDNYTQKPDFDYYAYHNGSFWEPFCGIYTANGLQNLKQDNDYSMQHVLSSGQTQKNKILNMASFKNYNLM
jgi:molybdopterin-guanine dinucleotide biosynthesis protein A